MPAAAKNNTYILTAVLLSLTAVLYIELYTDQIRYDIRSSWQINEPVDKQMPRHVKKPVVVKGLYLTASSAANKDYRASLLQKMSGSRINSVVIDIKDYSGYVLYPSDLEILKKSGAIKAVISDVQEILNEFHRAGVYVIARQTVFQDPVLAQARPELALRTKTEQIWQDYKGLSWLDPNKKAVWNYNLAIAKEAVNLGFDEINFDYIRYPSDGNLENLEYNLAEGQEKSEVMKNFFQFLSDHLSDTASTSIDMFGLVMDNTASGYDLGIGQKITDAADYFDFVSPMMYPSHYALNYLGFANAAEHPGAVVSHGLAISQTALKNKRALVRPWLQAFSLGAIYNQNMIDQQIQAVENVTSTDGWLLWNARNYYPDYIFK